jgi:hypothetical protein
VRLLDECVHVEGRKGTMLDWIKRHWVLCTLVPLGVLLAAVVWFDWHLYDRAQPDDQAGMRGELFKATLQLALLGVIGGAVTFMYQSVTGTIAERRKDAEQQIADAAAKRERRRLFVERLGEDYRSVKETRRMLRAAGIERTFHHPPLDLSNDQLAEYARQMLVINKAQLDLEALQIEADHFDIVDNKIALVGLLSNMEDYLSQIVSEYEAKRPKLPVNFGNLPKLDEFTWDIPGGQRTARTFPDFSRAHKSAIKELAKVPLTRPNP